MPIYRDTLPNGLEIIAEPLPHARSVSLGFVVRTGARDELPAWNGVSHFLEHMVFKGNAEWLPADVNRRFDELGADNNAETGEETTRYYLTTLPEHLPEACALLASILTPAVREADFAMEKGVILEEIAMYADQPLSAAYDRALAQHFRGVPLGQTILGSTHSVEGLSAAELRAYHAQQYRAGQMAAVVAGAVDWPTVRQLVAEHCGQWPAGVTPRQSSRTKPQPSQTILTRPTLQQQHVVQLCAAPSANESARFAADLLSVVVGDDQNSRLFWSLVDPGLAEFAEVSYTEFQDTGMFSTFVCCSPEETDELLARVGETFDEVNRRGITAEELAIAKAKIGSRIVLRGEQSWDRFNALCGQWGANRECRDLQQDLAILDQISLDSIRTLLEEYPLRQTTTVTIGPLEQLTWAPAKE